MAPRRAHQDRDRSIERPIARRPPRERPSPSPSPLATPLPLPRPITLRWRSAWLRWGSISEQGRGGRRGALRWGPPSPPTLSRSGLRAMDLTSSWTAPSPLEARRRRGVGSIGDSSGHHPAAQVAPPRLAGVTSHARRSPGRAARGAGMRCAAGELAPPCRIPRTSPVRSAVGWRRAPLDGGRLQRQRRGCRRRRPQRACRPTAFAKRKASEDGAELMISIIHVETRPTSGRSSARSGHALALLRCRVGRTAQGDRARAPGHRSSTRARLLAA